MRIVTLAFDKSSDWYDEEEGNRPFLTLVMITYGRCVYWIGDTKTVLEKGQILLIPGHIQYYGKSIPTMLHEKYVLRFSADGLSEHLPLLQAKEPVHVATRRYEWMADRIKVLYSHWNEKQDYADILCGALLLEMLVYINRELDQEPVRQTAQQLAEQMKAYIQNHYREHVTKESLAEVIQRSPNHAAAVFRKATGQTISEFVHAQRLKTAIYMLRHSALTVAEISEFVGYSDPSYFYRIFKRMTGQVPMEYIQERETNRK